MNPSNSAYDLTGNMLKYLVTNTKQNAMPEAQWADGDFDWWKKGVLRQFYQDEFLDTFVYQIDGLAKYGYIFYPNKCVDGSEQCRVHMHLHGCGQTADGLFLGYQALSDGGWMEYAVANNIILVLPQAKFDLFSNPRECFDYTNYAEWWDETEAFTWNGIQPKALKGMLDRVI